MIPQQENNESSGSDDMFEADIGTETVKYPRKKAAKKITKMQKMVKAQKQKDNSKSTDKDLQMRRQSEQAKIATKLIIIEDQYHCKEETCSFMCSVQSKYKAWAHARKEDCSIQKKKRRHTQVIHECTELNCEKSFSSKATLKKHFQTDHRETLHTCDKCEKQFKSRKYMINHIKKAHIEDMQSVCDECGKTCLNAKLLEKHQKEKHSFESEDKIKNEFETLCGNKPVYEQWKALTVAALNIASTTLG